MGYRHDYQYYHRHGRGGCADSRVGSLVAVILEMIAMSLVGIDMLLKGNDDGQKTIGTILIILGFIIWIAVAKG